jgi:hypothetical protein
METGRISYVFLKKQCTTKRTSSDWYGGL